MQTFLVKPIKESDFKKKIPVRGTEGGIWGMEPETPAFIKEGRQNMESSLSGQKTGISPRRDVQGKKGEIKTRGGSINGGSRA